MKNSILNELLIESFKEYYSENPFGNDDTDYDQSKGFASIIHDEIFGKTIDVDYEDVTHEYTSKRLNQ